VCVRVCVCSTGLRPGCRAPRTTSWARSPWTTKSPGSRLGRFVSRRLAGFGLGFGRQAGLYMCRVANSARLCPTDVLYGVGHSLQAILRRVTCVLLGDGPKGCLHRWALHSRPLKSRPASPAMPAMQAAMSAASYDDVTNMYMYERCVHAWKVGGAGTWLAPCGIP